ncbi:MAG: SMI1/KNR4 family protein [Ruminococcus flavefaciens]|nr:SMI1/KNR4 family protein [Ruminococcus flavefaciens]MCM1229535.1 SMI1/KNR4 family protein [Ruminococcus flavefaciens]
MKLSKYEALDYPMDFPERIKKLAELAGEADKNCEVFGSGKYKYTFNLPAKIAGVRKFEEKYNIRIPADFVEYLTEVGNGGAGVDYGVYSLQDMDVFNEGHLLDNDYDKTIFDYDNYEEVWKNLITEMDKTDDDEIYKQLTNGWLVIGTSGCTYDYILICKGNNYGKIAIVDWNMEAENYPKILANSFESWIENYFTKIIEGDLIDHGYFKTVRK